jgi:hypothetical protein
MPVDKQAARPQWHRTGNAYFPAAAQVNGAWWVLRINSFPDHPLWTLFVDGVRQCDVNDIPSNWGIPTDPSNPQLDKTTATGVLAALVGLTDYGSEDPDLPYGP